MNLKKFKLLSWNCKGLGSLEKCSVVRNVIRSSRCDVVCMQETKWNKMNLIYVSTVLPSFFEFDCMYIDAIGSRGGSLISWKRKFQLFSAWSTRHTISVHLTEISTGQHFIITNTYGPSVDQQKSEYILELRRLATIIDHPWLIAGDFNLVRWLVDRSGDMRGN